MSDFTAAVACDPAALPLDASLRSFATALSELGFSPHSVHTKCATAAAFTHWLQWRGGEVATIDERVLEVFLESSGRRSTPSTVRRCSLRAFLEHLRTEGRTRRAEPHRDTSAAATMLARYEQHLRVERGLTESTLDGYRPFVRTFLQRHLTDGERSTARSLVAQDVRAFLLERSRDLAPRRVQLFATALRSILRFLFLRGETATDLSAAVPTVRTWRRATVHPYLAPDEVKRLLDSCDQRTSIGRRDRAILLLLARLGMRASEVAALELADLRWRSGEIVVRGKGRSVESLPLLPDVGAAVADYLRRDRPPTACRAVFLRHDAPRVPLAGESVGSIVVRALRRTGLRPARGGAHVLRFSLATSLIRRGASMAQIGMVLRHRSPETTEIYAKVDFDALRQVALPWTAGGAL